MTGKKAYLFVQSLLCALLAGWLAAAAVRMYVEGAAVQASGELFHYIFTREKAAAALKPMAPLFFASLGVTVSGWLLGVKDDAPSISKAVSPLPGKAVSQEGARAVSVTRAAVLALAVAFITLGILNGGLEDVLTKANAICMECVGLG
ncbi:MAG: hypothetical protein IK099_10225 [Clostridia bacterium]|nr:hypothetical protein [Clostridia bacterium]